MTALEHALARKATSTIAKEYLDPYRGSPRGVLFRGCPLPVDGESRAELNPVVSN